MFSSPASSPTNRFPLPHPSHSDRCRPERSEGSAFRFSPLCALSVSAFSFPDVSPLNLKLSTVNFPSLSPFAATLTGFLQLTENKTTLSPAFATLTRRVKLNPFVCHSYKKHPGRGVTPFKPNLLPPEPNHSSLTTLYYYSPYSRAPHPRANLASSFSLCAFFTDHGTRNRRHVSSIHQPLIIRHYLLYIPHLQKNRGWGQAGLRFQHLNEGSVLYLSYCHRLPHRPRLD
jgi:hypothetical protein